jgi:hypothetical protein
VHFSKSANRIGAATRASLFLSLACVVAATGFARADDYGPSGDVRELRFVAQRLLAQRARAAGADPKAISVPDVVVVANSALLSWDYGMPVRNSHGVMGLVRQEARWWDALDDVSWNQSGLCWNTTTAYPLQPAGGARGSSRAVWLSYGLPAELIDRALQVPGLRRAIEPPKPSPPPRDRGYLLRAVCPFDAIYGVEMEPAISRTGGVTALPRSELSGYGITIHYTENTSDRTDRFARIYARPPTAAEIIPYPTTQRFISTSVAYFDLTIDSTKPVTFAPGTTIDIWFPFVLDDTLNYDLTIGFAQEPIGPVYAKPFDNVLHYKLPGFTAMPGQTLMAEIDGNWP